MPCRELTHEESLNEQLTQQVKNNHYLTRLLCHAVEELNRRKWLNEVENNEELFLWHSEHSKFDATTESIDESLYKIAHDRLALLKRVRERVILQLTSLELRALGLE